MRLRPLINTILPIQSQPWEETSNTDYVISPRTLSIFNHAFRTQSSGLYRRVDPLWASRPDQHRQQIGRSHLPDVGVRRGVGDDGPSAGYTVRVVRCYRHRLHGQDLRRVPHWRGQVLLSLFLCSLLSFALGPNLILSRLLQDSAVRMRWRLKTALPEYLTPNTVYEVEVNLWNTSYILAPVTMACYCHVISDMIGYSSITHLFCRYLGPRSQICSAVFELPEILCEPKQRAPLGRRAIPRQQCCRHQHPLSLS